MNTNRKGEETGRESNNNMCSASASADTVIGPILWGYSGPLCHALSLSLSLWTSILHYYSAGGVRRLAVAKGPNIFQMLLVNKSTVCVQSGLKYNSAFGKCLERIHYNTLHTVAPKPLGIVIKAFVTFAECVWAKKC